MKPIFNDALHERFGTWPLGYISYGGLDYGEIVTAAEGAERHGEMFNRSLVNKRSLDW